MALLDRWRRRTVGEPTPIAVPLRVLRASGQRMDLTSRDVGARILATRQGWQTDAWDYHARIGELAYALRLLAQQVAKARYFAAEIRPYPAEPADLAGKDHDLDKRLAADAVENLARIPLDDDGVDSFTATLCRNLCIAGEAWIHGQRSGDEESWEVRSVSEIVARGDQVFLSEIPTQTSLGQRLITEDEELLRCWVRNPRYGQLADSPLSSTLDVLEGIVLDGREMRAAAQSRIAANGMLLVPESLSLVRTRTDEEELLGQAVADDDFMADLTEAMITPIRNEGHAGAVVPLVLRGSAEDLKEVRHVKIERDDAVKIMERLTGGVLRMLKSLDIQPEQVEGMSGINHWTGYVVEAKDVKQQVDPWSATIAGCVTKAFLRPALLSLGYSPDEVRRVAVWRDITGLMENPNRSQDAREAHDRMVISDSRFRQDCGYDDDDAPDEDELQRRIAAKAGIDQATSAIVLDLASRLQQGRQQPRVIEQAPANELPAGQGARSASPGETVPEQPTPQGPRGVTAAATPELPTGWRVDADLARVLADVDAALVDRIVTAADAAIARAVERAGGRARNAVRKDQALSAAVAGKDAVLVAAIIGRDRLSRFASIPDLLADAYGRLRAQFGGWLAQSAQSVADAILRLLGLSRRSPAGVRMHDAVTSRLAVHQDAAWTEMAQILDRAAERAMFRADPLTPEPAGRGEEPDALISPAEVVRVLTVAGGGRPDSSGGLGSGPVVSDVLTGQGAVLLGHEWQYRPERTRGSHFGPHMALDGIRFATWTDPKLDTLPEHRKWLGNFYRPQDHDGCRCGSTPVWATPELDDGVVERRLREARESVRGRAASRVAAEDYAAGRVGTSIQNEVEVRNRITADVARLRQHYIEQGG